MLLTEFLEFHAMARPESPMLIKDGETISFAEAMEKARGAAMWLHQRNIGKGDRVAILGENSMDHILLLIAASYVGAVLVPLNYRLAAAELAQVIADADTRLLLISDPAMDELKADLLPRLEEPKIFVDTLQQENFNEELITTELNEEDVLIQLYTSGTTGLPKGVQLNQKNLEGLAIPSWMMYSSKAGVGTTDLVVAPLFHIGGLGSAIIPIMAGGAVLLHSSFDPMKIVDDIERHGVNTLFLVPVMIQTLLNTVPNIRDRDFSSLKQMAYGASPISPSVLEEAMAVFGCHFLQLYGMTETAGAIVAMLPDDHRRAIDGRPELLQSCGRAMAGVKVKVCDSEGRSLPPGETGEIAINSPSNTAGYWNRPDETKKAIRDGWIYTGDAGIIDEEGFIYIRDRVKDMVVTGGENVYPVESEKVIQGHPSVLEAAVIGIPNEKYGEALLAVCALNSGCELTADELIEYCRDKIAGYKIPRQLLLVDALPRNPSGKILKTVLREPYWKDHQRKV